MRQDESLKLFYAMTRNRPTIGVALSGGSSRAIAQIGVLEVFEEQGIPIDYLVGCSSGALVAVSYVAHKMKWLKEWMHSMNMQKLINMWAMTWQKGGIFDFGAGEAELKRLVEGITFENCYPKLGLTAADINTGELVTLSSGDVTLAVKASIAVPALFPPVIWENKLLVDGGLVNIVPTIPVKQMGANIVIGVNVSGARFIYEKKLPYWRFYRMLLKYLGISYLTRTQVGLVRKVLDRIKRKDNIYKETKPIGILRILARALDRSMEISDKWSDADMTCDYMITPKVKQWRKTELKNLNLIYEEGRRAALEAIPTIKKLMENSAVQSEVRLTGKTQTNEA